MHATTRDVRRPRQHPFRPLPPRSPTWRIRAPLRVALGAARARRGHRGAWRAASTSPRSPRPMLVWWLDHRLAAAQPGLGRRQGDRLEGGAGRASRAAPARSLRQRGCRRCSSVSCSTRSCSPGSASSRASRCSLARQAAGRGEHSCFDDRRQPALAEQLVLGVALALALVGASPVMHLPHMIWQLVIVFVLVLAAVVAALMDRAAQRPAAVSPMSSRGSPPPGRRCLSQPRAHGARDGGRHVLVGRADRRASGRRSRPFGIHVGLAVAGLVFVSLDDRAAVPLLAGQIWASSSSA